MKPLNKLFSPQTYITLILYRSAKDIQQLKCVLSSVFILVLIVMWAAESTDNQYPLFLPLCIKLSAADQSFVF